MINKSLYLILFLFLTLELNAQYRQNFLVTTQNDTIRGDVRRITKLWGSPEVRINAYNGNRYRMPLEDVSAYRSGREHFIVVNHERKNCGRRHEVQRVIEQGAITLSTPNIHQRHHYEDEGHQRRRETLYVNVDDRHYLLNRQTMEDCIWPHLMACPAFAELHGDYTTRRVRRLTSDFEYRTVILMIRKYNQICSH